MSSSWSMSWSTPWWLSSSLLTYVVLTHVIVTYVTVTHVTMTRVTVSSHVTHEEIVKLLRDEIGVRYAGKLNFTFRQTWLTWLIAVAMSRRHASAAHSRTPSIVFGHAPGLAVWCSGKALVSMLYIEPGKYWDGWLPSGR